MEEHFRRLQLEAQNQELQQESKREYQKQQQFIREYQQQQQQQELRNEFHRKELIRYYHYQVEAAKDREWQLQLDNYINQERREYYQKEAAKVRRLENMGADLERLTRTAPIHHIHQGSVEHKPSHFSLFSYNIHDKDAFRKSISRPEEKPKKDVNNQSTIKRGFVKKERASSLETPSPSINVSLSKRKCQEYLNG